MQLLTIETVKNQPFADVFKYFLKILQYSQERIGEKYWSSFLINIFK